MDVQEAFRSALGSISQAREQKRESSHDSEDHGPRIAHTLAACCRCRQRKTRCDPALPRCGPCERTGAVCEYFDTTKNKKISRNYVIKLQDKVRALETELGQFTDEDLAPPKPEDSIRPGGLVRLDERDETPRFLGPSSGIAMTRLVMEEAKRYTDSRTIRELVPDVVTRRTPVSSPGAEPPVERKKSYPMISAVAADKLPGRLVTDKLVEVFNQKAQYLFPTIHEPTFAQEINDVYNGDEDPYKNYVLRMVLAISMQKLDAQYAGLADSYYLAAMSYVEKVITPKDIKTVQCLVLIAQYSLLTPTRTAIYYIIGLAVRLCQQLGLTEEKTITQGSPTGYDPLQMDMRRRMAWCVLNMEFGLSHSLGRPSGFAIRENDFDVKFIAKVDDQYITKDGILDAPLSEKKVMCEHFFYMRLLQARIRRVLYQRKRDEPKDDNDPWFLKMKEQLDSWLDNCPTSPPWSKSWFTSKYNTMIVFLYRPSPQVPKPSVRAAQLCYEASAYNIKSQNQQIDNPSFDITWIFLQALFMAVNTILWTISYPEVRADHSQQELEEHIQIALSVITRCSERWPGSASAAGLYEKLSKACMRSYSHSERDAHSTSSLSASSPASLVDYASPNSEHSAATTGSQQYQHAQKFEPPPAFGSIFNEKPDNFAANEYHKNLTQQPSFRSNSIFVNPSTMQTDRRFSYFPPEFQQMPDNWGGIPPLPQHTQPMQTSQIQPQLRARSGLSTVAFSQPLAPPAQQQQPPLQQQPQLQLQPPSFTTNMYSDPTYFIQAPAFNFAPHMYAEESYNISGRADSLSHSQQQELMQHLETDGLIGIDDYLGLVPQQHFFGSEG